MWYMYTMDYSALTDSKIIFCNRVDAAEIMLKQMSLKIVFYAIWDYGI